MAAISIPKAIQILSEFIDEEDYPPFTEDAKRIRELLWTVQRTHDKFIALWARYEAGATW